jgi:signal transduction histidine kinase/CheY-like chemotaxis protein/CHASE3 domain sensor protein
MIVLNSKKKQEKTDFRTTANTSSAIDSKAFNRTLRISGSLPLVITSILTATFIGLIFHLVSEVHSVDHVNQVVAQAHETQQIILDSEIGMRGFLLAGREEFLDPYNNSIRSADHEIKKLEDMAKTHPEQIARLERVSLINREWKEWAQKNIELKRSGNNEYLKRVSIGQGKHHMDEIRGQFKEFIRFEEKLHTDRSESTQEAIRLVLIVIVTVSGLAGIFLALYTRKQLKSLSDSFGSVLLKQSELNLSLLQEDWLRTGLSELNDLSRTVASLTELSTNIINHLAHYTGAQVGAFYVLSEDEEVLRRISTYAFSSEDEAKRSEVKLKEGLVGQAATLNRLLQITELPENYIHVNSSLGAAIPKALLIAPASAEGSVKAVLELGFLSVPDPRVIELLERASLGIALTIRSWQYRTRVQNLLGEAQTFNEELQTQQEELKAANEELEEQSRALQDSQSELEQQRDILNENNEALNKTQKLLEEKSDEAQRANQYKSEFLANMSHELRTPLNSSLILAKLLADNASGNLTKDQIQYAQSIYSSGNELAYLINDILDLSKVEAGMLEIRPESVFLPKVLNSLKSTFQPLADQKKLEFQIKIDPGVPETILTDRQRLEQILKNLLSNAFKFTEKGQITLHVSRCSDERLSLVVIDTGIGIPKAQKDVIFEAFRQADGTTNRKYGGTGLGLSISRDLARLLGGSIELESMSGEGSRFSLLLPENYDESLIKSASTKAYSSLSSISSTVEKAKPRVERVKPAPFSDDRYALVSPGRTLLVIEDEPQFAQILFDLAHELHYKCVVAQGAEEGLHLAKSLLPDAILLDIKLPDHSGLMVLDQLKEDLTTRHIPIHIASVDDYMEKAFQMGAIGYILKPAKRDELKAAFIRIESKLSQKIKRVLVVEDDKLQRESVVKLIADIDVEITAVALASEALVAIKTIVYDCIVIDLKLPDMSGEQLLKKMTEQEEMSSFPPVIVYTGRSLTRDEEDQLRKYSRSIIIKGARSPERLLDEVSLFLHRVESKLSPEKQQILKVVRSREDDFEGRKILIADDDIRNVFALTAALEQKGAQIVIARNGKEALTRLEEDPRIDLVLMDIMMPEMDGLQATREIRKQKRFAKLPIIAITAKATKNDQMLCIEAGANDYLAKPIDVHQLFSLTRVWMPKLGRD